MSSPDPRAAAAIRIVLIEDQRDTREGLAFLIDHTPGFRCIGSYRGVDLALARIAADPPHLVLTDLALPGVSGIEGIRRLRAQHPDLPVIALTVHQDDEHVFEALCAGAVGYLLKTTPPPRLMEGLRDVIAGGAAMSPEIARRLLGTFTQAKPTTIGDHRLTPHEMRLLKLLGEGHSYRTAAVELTCSVNTVAFHVRNIYRKLQVHSKSQAVAKALRSGLL
jgi:DNA-binding NarL/FixJ family response regulator